MIVGKKNLQGGKTKLIFENLNLSSKRFYLLLKVTFKYG